jgi:hypothetical protein
LVNEASRGGKEGGCAKPEPEQMSRRLFYASPIPEKSKFLSDTHDFALVALHTRQIEGKQKLDYKVGGGWVLREFLGAWKVTEMSIKKAIRIAAAVSTLQTIVWVIFTAISMSQVKREWTNADYITWVSKPDFFFTGNYINATFLTINVIVLFSLLYEYIKEKSSLLAIIGLSFVPAYGLLNLVCYSIQISYVPDLALHAVKNGIDANILVAQLIQANAQSIIGFLNGMAYALLGIPSVLYGIVLLKKSMQLSGLFLSLNGISCIIGIIGNLFHSQLLSSLIGIGGVLFLISAIVMVFDFGKNE